MAPFHVCSRLLFAVSFTTLLVLTVLGTSDVRIDLNGNDWKLSNGSSMPAISAMVPGQVYPALMQAAILSDPYYGMQPMIDQWVAKSDWIYTKSFSISQESALLSYRVIQLVADGIDSKANISINNQLVFENDNMFHRNRANIKSYLQYGTNTITVYLYNKVEWATDEHNSCDASKDGQCPGSSQNADGFYFVNYIRTEPCSFSWDWGPAYAPVGIWRGISIQAFNESIISDFMVYATPVNSTTHREEENDDEKRKEAMTEDEWLIYNAFRNREKALKDYTAWNTTLIVYVNSGAQNILYPASENEQERNRRSLLPSDNIGGVIKVSIPSWKENVAFTMSIEMPPDTEMNFSMNLGVLSGIDAWMPNGWGSQTIYDVEVHFVDAANASDTGKHHGFGFREVQLIQEALPGGRSFYFRVNGENIPVHGSNWIPSYALDNSNYSVNTQSLEPLFISLADSHQNMIRNWGGGIYQQQDFYDLADKYGIMIWQDFMFACAQYWTNPVWLNSVSKEVIDTVREIQHHPAIAIWAANNENGGACQNGQESETAYVDLYWKAVLDNVAALDPIMRPRVSSSPSNGNETEAEPCAFNGNTQDPFYGDVHQYLYNKDCWNTSIYVKARFVSEFGWQSWPAYSTMTQFLPEDEWSYNSATMQNRQHHPNGQAQMVTEIQLHYGLPADWNGTGGYQYMLYATQYSQAYCYKTEVEFFRSLRETCSSTLPGCTMGSMYWQTNDIWPGASWSGVDYLNRYKLVAYYAKHFYAKVIVTGYDNGENYTFWAINDYTTEFRCDSSSTPCVIAFQSLSFANSAQMNEWNVSVSSMDYESAQQVYSLSHSAFLAQSKCPSLSNDCALKWKLVDTSANRVVTENWMFISSPKNTKAKDPELKITSVSQRSNEANTFTISFSNANIAAFVYMETNISGTFEDNGFGILLAGQYQVQFNASETTTAAQLQKSLYLYSLYEAGGFAG